MQILDSFAA